MLSGGQTWHDFEKLARTEQWPGGIGREIDDAFARRLNLADTCQPKTPDVNLLRRRFLSSLSGGGKNRQESCTQQQARNRARAGSRPQVTQKHGPSTVCKTISWNHHTRN